MGKRRRRRHRVLQELSALTSAMTRAEILSSPEYWITHIQIEVCRCADAFMKAHNMNRAQLADYLGVTQGAISQMLAGNYNCSLSKLVDIAIRLGYVPKIDFTPLSEKMDVDAASEEDLALPKQCPAVMNSDERN